MERLRRLITSKLRKDYSLYSKELREEELRHSVNIAYSLFTNASIHYPSSVTAQGADIAFACKELNQSPLEIGLLLRKDQEKVAAVTKAANALHRAKNNGPKTGEGKLLMVESGWVKDIIDSDFTTAEHMMILTKEQIEDIRNQYTYYYPPTHHGYTYEHEYAGYAYYQINQVRLEKGLERAVSPILEEALF